MKNSWLPWADNLEIHLMELARTILITLIAAMMAASGTTKTQTNAESMTVRIHGLLTMHAAPAEEDMTNLEFFGKAI
jgi:hypothetical protein